MNKLEKLKLANQSVQEMILTDNLTFFTRLLPQKMEEFRMLTYFDEIGDKGFQKRLSFLRDQLLTDINWCKESKPNETDEQKKMYIEYVQKVYSIDV